MKTLTVEDLNFHCSLQEAPIPEPKENEVLIRVFYSGVSLGTERGIASGVDVWWGPPPFVSGYQLTGQIETMGAKVTGLKKGDLVAAFAQHAHAQFALADANLVAKIDESIIDVAAFSIQVAVAANAVNRAGVSLGDQVLVVGQGLVGQCCTIFSTLRGAMLTVVDTNQNRLREIREVCSCTSLSAIEALSEPAEQEKRFDIAFEVSGSQAVISPMIRSCREGAKLMHIAFFPKELSYTFGPAQERLIQILFSNFIGPPTVLKNCLSMLTNKIVDIRPLITHRIIAEQSPVHYSEAMKRKDGSYNGLLIDWRNA